MSQSLASPHINARPQGSPSPSPTSVLVGVWSAAVTAARKLGSTVSRLRASLGNDIAAPIDINQIAAQLDIKGRAHADGSSELPISTEEVVSGTQREIVAHFNGLQRRAQRQAAAATRRMHECRERIDLLHAAGRLREIMPRCEDRLMRLDAESQSRRNLLEEREIQQQQYYAGFREANRLARAAEYPPSPLINIALAGALIAVLAIVVGRIAPEGGAPLVPSAVAMSIAFAGVLVPFVLAATALPSINHVDQSKRFSGWLGGAIAAAVIGTLALFVAYYVAAASATAGISLRAVIDAILVDPIGSATAVGADGAAWTGFAAVLSAGLLAYLIGYKSDDPYPGYGGVQRAFYEARRQRELHAKRLRRRVNGIVDTAAAEASDLPKRLKAEVRRYSGLVEESKRAAAALREYDASLEDACNLLLDRYRAGNSVARQTETPISFSEQVCFGREPASRFDNEEAWVQEFQRGIAELEREAADVRRKLKDLHWTALASLTGATSREG
jgi:hypothetical protein